MRWDPVGGGGAVLSRELAQVSIVNGTHVRFTRSGDGSYQMYQVHIHSDEKVSGVASEKTSCGVEQNCL